MFSLFYTTQYATTAVCDLEKGMEKQHNKKTHTYIESDKIILNVK